MYRSSPLRSTLNTGYIAGLDMCKVCTEAVHCAALWTCVQVQKNVIIPTPPHPTLSHVMCARVTLHRKNDAKLCLCVVVTPVGVRGWLWKMAVCARDSSLCARVTLGGKIDANLCPCVLVTPECVSGWPPDLVQPPTRKTSQTQKMWRKNTPKLVELTPEKTGGINGCRHSLCSF